MAAITGKEAKKIIDDFLLCELADGQTTSRTHDCESALKQRLYFTRKGGTTLFMCHHCGISGAYREKDSYSRINEEHTHGVPSSILFNELSAHPLIRFKDMPLETRLWLLMAGITEEMLEEDWLFAHLYFNCTPVGNPVMYVRDALGNCNAIQRRNLTGVPSGVKYTTTLNPAIKPEDRTGAWYGEPQDTVFIVEDMRSAYRIMKAGGFAFALLGTKKQPVMPTAKQAVLWLDPDVAGMKGAIELGNELRPLYPRFNVIGSDREAKEFRHDDLQKCIAILKE